MAKKESILVRPPAELDRFNDPVGLEPEWLEIHGATCVPRNSSEGDKRGPIVISGFMVALNAPVRDSLGALVRIDDDWELQIRGNIHQIDGAVGDYGRKIILYTMRVS